MPSDNELLPSESLVEHNSRMKLAGLLKNSPISAGQLVDNLGLYLRRQPLMRILAFNALYQMILNVPGAILQFGVHHGRDIATLTSLRSIYEPYVAQRRIIGFDTFDGFPPEDMDGEFAPVGTTNTFAMEIGYRDHLTSVLEALEETEHLRHIKRSYTLVGDVRDTLPDYLRKNPQTIIALAYFDLDLYDATHKTLSTIRPYLTKGSIVAFDQINHPKWPGETAAIRDCLGTNTFHIQGFAGHSSPHFIIWGQ